MEALGLSKRQLSLKLRKGQTYIHDYLVDETPRDLPYELKLLVAEILGMSLRELGIAAIADEPRSRRQGMAESDAEPWTPPPGHFLSSTPHIAYFKQSTRSLDQHARQIMPGQVLAFDLNRVDPADIRDGEIVVVQKYDKHELTRGLGTIIRQFVPPNKLITNSSEVNEILSIDDATLPFELVIKGVYLSSMNGLN